MKRHRVPGNQRQVRVFLTAKGAALRGAIVGAAEEVNRIALAGIAPEDAAAARRVLVRIVENLGREPA
ncbi:MAG TPA: MarR family winged helix-turn-helix transcriptional regulator [Usitatibacter sp.]